MLKKFILAATAIAGFSGSILAQAPAPFCGTDQVNNELRQKFPEIVQRDAQLEAEIMRQLSGMDLSRFYKTTGLKADTGRLHIPIVVHVIHNYGSENVSDNAIYTMVRQINDVFLKRNSDTTAVIPTFRGSIRGTTTAYIANSNIEFHLAQRDPQGRPTNGITRRRNYLTAGGNNFAKFDGWAPDSYLNIWLIKNFSNMPGVAAYAYKPAAADNIPYWDGAIGSFDQTGGNFNVENTLAHEIGHSLNLDHPWGGNNENNVACGDDNVDDTPPTKGAPTSVGCTHPSIYDTSCTMTTVAIAKPFPDPTDSFPDRVVNRGITFYTRTKTTISSVEIYPQDTTGMPFSIVLRRNGSIIATYNGTVDSGMGRKQVVPVNFVCPADSPYTITFGTNPNAHRDSMMGPLPTNISGVAGALRIVNPSTDGLYNYFYNWRIRYGYFKIYDSSQMVALYDSVSLSLPKRDNGYILDYPDTANAQNIMDYMGCSKMFTNGQALRMRATLRSNIGRRNTLIDSLNQVNTGIRNGNSFSNRMDVRPTADFSINTVTTGQGASATVSDKVYVCKGTNVTFTNRSWGDTISSVQWNFPNGANIPTSTSVTSVTNSFSQPGYVNVELIATGNNGSGSDTEQRAMVYVADQDNKINALGYFQEFNAGGDLDRYPIFNYFNNDQKWEVVNNTGFYDKASIRYHTFDPRTGVNVNIGSPGGDYDDFFMPPMDLTSMASGDCNFNFMFAGASRTSSAVDMNDQLEIAFSKNCGDSWTVLKTMTKGEINTVGVRANDWMPTGGDPSTGFVSGEWRLASLPIAVGDRTNNVLFRIRYRPGVATTNQTRIGTGNNFYMDRINISAFPTGVDGIAVKETGITLSPNPTNGGATVMMKGNVTEAQMVVTDVTGKVVFRANQGTQGAGFTRFEIPAANVAVKGIYFVQVAQGDKKHTEKLVVY